MSPEKEQALCKAFPHLFRDRNAPLTQSLMAFGCECSDGWYDLIYETCTKIEPMVTKMIDDAIKEKDFDRLDFIPAFIQIKEKYGSLCLYLTTGTDEIYDIIEEAEKKSATTCEECGKPGEVRGEGWLYCRCNECWKKLEEGRYGR